MPTTFFTRWKTPFTLINVYVAYLKKSALYSIIIIILHYYYYTPLLLLYSIIIIILHYYYYTPLLLLYSIIIIILHYYYYTPVLISFLFSLSPLTKNKYKEIYGYRITTSIFLSRYFVSLSIDLLIHVLVFW